MTTLHDPLDDLLREFRADEARIDDDLRDRIWDEVVAATGIGGTDIVPRRRPPDRRARRVLGLAAALLAAALAGAGLARATVDDPGTVTAGTADAPGTTDGAPLPTLDELADDAAARQDTVLGEPGATYAHIVASFVYHAPPGSGDEDAAGQIETWVGLDGTGRERSAQADGSNAGDTTVDEPGSLLLGTVTPEAAIALPDDGGAVLDQMVTELGAAGPDDPGASRTLVDLLAQPGLPGTARAGALRALGVLGFEVGPGAAPGTVTLTGPGADGSTLTVELHIETARVRSRVQTDPDGGTTATWFSEADLRPTTD